MSEIDFAFAWEGASGVLGPWQHLRVLEIRGTEEISNLFRYEITAAVLEPDREVDPEELVRARATLRIATFTQPRYRLVHGVITEAEELGVIDRGMQYRLILSPSLVRAAHRTRCRIFLEKTTRQIIDAVLQCDPDLTRADGTVVEIEDSAKVGYTPARDLYAWRIADPSRIDDVETRPYCVQYNESDLAFVSRLLEEEGISYHFEGGDDASLLVLSDSDVGRARLAPFAPLGADVLNRVVTTMKLGARLRPRKVSLLDYNWKNPALSMAVEQPSQAGPSELVAHEYPGLYPDTPTQGLPLATAMLDRLEVEASYAVGEGYCRVLGAGSVFALEHTRGRWEGEYLVTKLVVHGIQHGAGGVTLSAAEPGVGDIPRLPYTATFECARRGKGSAAVESRFRPARVTPKPRIIGTQTAFVTADPSAAGAEIHIGGPPGAEIGCVRVRFHWDQDLARQAAEPSSCWVRASQVFAGPGQGAVWHPRVGVEVIVDYEDGDPDRPIIVGRVYNGRNQPPTVVPTVSTFKSMTSPGGGTFNEFTFDDTAGSQQIKLHTPKDWNSEVGNDRTETVAANSTSSVGVARAEATGADRSTLVGANNAEIVGANETITVGANQIIGIGGDQDVGIVGDQNVGIDGNQSLGVLGNQSVAIEGDQFLAVTKSSYEKITLDRGIEIVGADALQVDGKQTVFVKGTQMTGYEADHQLFVKQKQSVQIAGDQVTKVAGKQHIYSSTEQRLAAPKQEITAETTQALTSAEFTASASKTAVVSAPEVDVAGTTILNLTGKKLVIAFTGDIAIKGANISIEGSTITLKGSKSITLDGGASVDVHAALIKLN